MPEAGVVSEKSPARVAIRSAEGPNEAQTGVRGTPRRAPDGQDGLGSTKGRSEGIRTEMSANSLPARHCPFDYWESFLRGVAAGEGKGRILSIKSAEPDSRKGRCVVR